MTVAELIAWLADKPSDMLVVVEDRFYSESLRAKPEVVSTKEWDCYCLSEMVYSYHPPLASESHRVTPVTVVKF